MKSTKFFKHNQSLKRDLNKFHKIIKALDNDQRLMILHELEEGELSISQLAEKIWISQPYCSMHIKKLVDVGLVKLERKGKESIPKITAELKVLIPDLNVLLLRVE